MTDLVLPTDLTFEEALEVTDAINQGLGSMANVYEAVRPFIHKSFAGRAWKTLGHSSPSEYVTKYFGDQLSRLGVDMRRDVVRELTEARISAREQAEILGVSHPTILRDQASGGTYVPPEEKVIARDGKEYSRPEPKPSVMSGPVLYTREEIQENERQAALEMGARTANFRVAECVFSLAGYDADRFIEEKFPRHKEFVEPGMRITSQRIAAAIDFLTRLSKEITE